MVIPEARIIGPEGAIAQVVRIEKEDGSTKLVMGFGEWLELPRGRYSVVGGDLDIMAGTLVIKDPAVRIDGIDIAELCT